MHFDPDNKIVRLCAEGMAKEGTGDHNEAASLFAQAWDAAVSDLEKFTAAHYVARHQKTAGDKLRWDEIALHHALRLDDDSMKGTFPSLYLNIAKCYEDLGDPENTKKNYELALSFSALLPDDGYGKMIRSGITNGIKRVTKNAADS